MPTGSYPNRKHSALGHRISRGWKNENEWDTFIEGKDKPFLLNPKKGFIVMANNPISTPYTKTPLSIHTPGTGRALRISKLLEELIEKKSGEIEYSDMIDILSDNKDLYAVYKLESMLKATKQFLRENPEFETESIKKWIDLFSNWDCVFDKDAQEPLYFTLWEYNFRVNFLSEQLDKDKPLKMKILSIAYFESVFLRIFHKLGEDSKDVNEYCTTYNGEKVNSCTESLVRALDEAINFLNTTHSGANVTWGDYHPMGYPNIPFTRTPLRKIFDRSVPVSGNANTVNVGAFRMFRYEEQRFTGLHSANLKIASEMYNNTVYYSLDTGVSENILSGHYFDMNERHLKNDLYPLIHAQHLEEHGMKKPDLSFNFVKETREQGKEDL